VESEASKGISYRQLGLGLGVTSTTIASWRDQRVATLSDDSIKAIAARRRESIEKTAAWLGVEAPDAYDWPAKFADMEKRMQAMERSMASLMTRLSGQDEIDPHLTLDSYLLERGVNVRSVADQEAIAAHIEQVAPEGPAAFERFLLIALGVISANSDDLIVVTAVLKRLTDDPWTPQEVHRVLSEGAR
jgi:hypothetical protein